MAIEVDSTLVDRPGTILMNALVGPCYEHFEIRRDDVSGEITYWIRSGKVSAEIYRDCINTAGLDRFDPLNQPEVPDVEEKEDSEKAS
jgi:hypothetical protein